MGHTPRMLTQLLLDDYQVKPGEYIGQAWEATRSHWLIFIGYLVLLLAISFALSLAAFPIDLIMSLILAPLFNAGWFMLAYGYLKNQTVGYPDLLRILVRFFDFLMIDLSFIGFSLLLSLTLYIFSVVSLSTCAGATLVVLAKNQGINVGYVDLQQGLPALMLASFLVGLLIINILISMVYLGTVLMFSKLLVIDQKINFWLAMVYSWRIVKRNFWPWLWFLVLLVLINLGGSLLCGLGLGLTIPLTFCALTRAYLDVVHQETAV